MKIGSLIFATEQGLGYLARDFVKHGVVTDVMIVNHGRRTTHAEWYPGAPVIHSLSGGREAAFEFCKNMDVMLFFETPFIWELLPYCREHGIKTILIPMFECEPKVLPAEPDLFICPSLLDLQYYPNRSVFIPVPVEVPWKQRREAKVFVHNAGNGGLKGRNGTAELMEALWLCNCLKGSGDARFIIRWQEKLPDVGPRGDLAGRITWHNGTVPAEQLYDEGDVFIFPEKFDGLSLPLQEAFAAGMLVMGADRFPMNTWLPKEPLIPISGTKRSNISPRCLDFDEAIVDPKAIAATIDRWYGQDITAYSDAGRQWAEETSWDVLKPRYMEYLCG